VTLLKILSSLTRSLPVAAEIDRSLRFHRERNDAVACSAHLEGKNQVRIFLSSKKLVELLLGHQTKSLPEGMFDAAPSDKQADERCIRVDGLCAPDRVVLRDDCWDRRQLIHRSLAPMSIWQSA
jgi:hypothetical protein